MDSSPNEKNQDAPPEGAGLSRAVRERLAAKIEELKKLHRTPSTGIEITRAYTLETDDVLKALFRSLGGEDAGVSLVALGGYGRGELNIRSDVDLTLLFDVRLTPQAEELSKRMLYVLWDAKLDVGFSVRSIDDTVELARTDSKTMTALLDARLLAGPQRLFDALEEAKGKKLFTGKELKNFIDDKVEERRLRHKKYGGSVYMLEPNVKEGEGGLRDLHSALWIMKAAGASETNMAGLLSEDDKVALWRSWDFLHWIRNELHFELGRKTDQMTFDQQERIAAITGFKTTDRMLAVEAFMQQYYRRASNINHYSGLIISRCLPDKKGGRGFFSRTTRLEPGVAVKDGVIFVDDPGLFEKDPGAVMRVFEYAGIHGAEIDRPAKDIVMEAAARNPDGLRNCPGAGASFRRMLAGKDAYRVLSEMHSMRVLERYIPEFGAVTCRVQHDMYHIYTVDAHSLFTVRELERLGTKEYRKDFKLLSELKDGVKYQAALMLAALMHDVGKALGKGHAEKGAALMPAVAARIGMTDEEASLVEFLVRKHLVIADTAQYRDMHDEKLVIEFARAIGDAERLAALYLLTFADVRAVGPEVWSQWKGALFQELYFKGLTVIERGSFEAEDVAVRVAKVRKEVEKAAAANGIPDSEVENYFGLLPSRYFLSNSAQTITSHMKAVKALGSDVPSAVTVRQVPERDYTEIVVAAHDVHGLFSMITGVLAANSINILGAEINTLKNGIALDVLQVKTAFGELLESEEKMKKVEADFVAVLTGKTRIATLVGNIRTSSILDRKTKPAVATRVAVDNEVSDNFTVIDIHAQDRIGLLYLISSTLTKLGLYIHLAKISTKGDAAADIFYVKDIFGQKIYFSKRLDEIKEALSDALAQ